MKQQLRQIYDALSQGRLSQEEALEKIKAIKRQEQRQRTGVLRFAPVWQAGGVDASGGAGVVAFAEHHVLLCELSPADAAQAEAMLPNSQCVSLQAAPQQGIAQRYSDCAASCFERIQTILRGKPQGRVLVQIVVADEQEQVLLAGLSALLKTTALENPQVTAQLVIVPADMTAEEVARRLGEEKLGVLDAQVWYERNGRQVLRWQELTEDAEKPPVAFKDGGVYLITGGLGGLGVLFAKEIVEQTRGAQIVLTGRAPLSAERQLLVDALERAAGPVTYRQLDLADVEQVRQLITGIRSEHQRLDGILHSAGMAADNFILKKTVAEFRQVLAPKVAGTVNLDEATRDVELDFFVLFSSIVGAMGNVGQADYAAANGFMDQFAAYRNRQVAAGRRHGRTRALNWPAWEAGGMGTDPASRRLLQETTGIQPMQTATGLDAFYRSLAWPYDQVLVAEGGRAQMRRALLAGRPIQPELSPLPSSPESSVASGAVPAAIAAEDGTLAEKTEEFLLRQCAELLKLPYHKIDPQAALDAYGIDSILAMKLTGHLEKSFGALSKTLFFEYQTIRELTGYFMQSHADRLATLLPRTDDGNRPVKSVAVMAEAPPSVPVKRTSGRRSANVRSSAPDPAPEADPIAIIGLSGRYPEAVDLEAYWRNLRDGKDCITEVPKDRWDWRQYFSEDRTKSGYHYSKWGGFIAGVDEFDPLFFNIVPKEARYMDPQERLFLEHVWMAIEDAGYTRAGLQLPDAHDLAGQVGVYVGLMYNEYQLFGAELSLSGERLGIQNSAASIANRVSYVLNLHGPSMTVDTMCSSSLTAIHLACQDLKLGRTSLAIAGGVNVTIHPNKYLMLSSGQVISSDGHCQSFGEGGDGYIPAEGVGVVVLKRLSKAEEDGDHIYGVIRGSALNHGGKTNGYTVPNPQAQASAIGRALAESQVDPRHISYIEAHGTGTKLGDPIEVAALSKAFHQYTQDSGFCLIGSAKSNIGHAESAAGIAGLTKVLLQMQHRQIVPSLHSAQLNPHIDFSPSPFVVNQSLRAWEQPVIDGRTLPRIAGISSFGAGGSNAHLLVEEYSSPAPQAMSVANVAENVAILLSARTAAQLQQKAADLLEFVRARSGSLDLVSMAYTLQVGREAMEERLAFVVSSVEQLDGKLQAYVAGQQNIEDAYSGQAKRNKEALAVFSADAELRHTLDQWIAGGKLSRLVDLWVKGLELDWTKLYGAALPRRISLPTYPFARERYWIDLAPAAPALVRSVTAAVLHPLLHINTSDLTHQSYNSTFSGDEFFLKDHQVDGHRTLPAAAYLEMARIAVQKAALSSGGGLLELREVIWAQPIAIDASTQVSIALRANDDGRIDYEIYTQGADQEIVHCQGRAAFSDPPATPRIDLAEIKRRIGDSAIEPASIYTACAAMGLVHGPAFQVITAIHRGSGELLARLRLPAAVAATSGDYVLHPSVIDGALQVCVGLIDPGQRPFAVQSLRIVAPCTPEMTAWVRLVPGSAAGSVLELDIDLCDEQGNVCAQMKGVSWRPATTDIAEPLAAPVIEQADAPVAPRILSAAPARKEIVFISHEQPVSVPALRKKPAAMSLGTPGKVVLTNVSSESAVKQGSAGRVPITLSSASASGSAAPAVSPVRLYDDGNGIFSIRITPALNSEPPAKDAIAHLRQALDRVQREASLKVLLLSGIERCFPGGGREESNEAVEQGLPQALASFSYPLIAVLQGDAIGPAFLAAALCDFLVCNEDASYGYTDARRHVYPTTAEAALLSVRFGEVRANDLLYVSGTSTARQLRVNGWTCPAVPEGEVEAHARELAATLAAKPQDALRLLKQHLTRPITGLVRQLTRAEIVIPTSRENAAAKKIASPASYIDLDPTAGNVLILSCRIGGVQGKELVTDLGRIFADAQAGGYEAIALVSDHPDFLPESISDDVVLDFRRLLLESHLPVVAALQGNATGRAWLISQFCDACVYNRAGVYSSRDVAQSAELAQIGIAAFTHRLGKNAGTEILLTGADYQGVELQQLAGTVIVADRGDVLQAAVEVAERWATLPQPVLAAWKQQTAATLEEKIRNLPAASEQSDETSGPLPAAATSIPLQSDVVTATVHPDGVVVVTMADRQAKNMFSDAFMEGVREAFAHIERTPAYKVVVLTGYDSYFASGGTKESLLAIQEGKARFTDVKTFQAALDCKLPVIAAMQGHGLGAGWCLGMFADVVLMSDESRYVSPYMNYGFTPGAGATYILAETIGQDVARESLLTAQTYIGRELKQRGVTLRVLPRAAVVPEAMALARQIARMSRGRLVSLKRQLTAHVRQPLEETYRLELAMHEKTFVGQSETLAQIQSNFYQEAEPSPVPAPTVVEAASLVMDGDLLSTVAASLKTLLANELQMRESDIDDSAQFVDLGLDSINGVSWIRKINEKYRTTIEATKIYSYSTLAQLSRYVKEEAEQQGTLPKQETTSAAAMPVAAPKRAPVLARTVTTRATGTLTSWRGQTASRLTSTSPLNNAPAPRRPQAIAIIGMAGQFPQAKNVDEFWRNLAEGRNCITQIPPNRWDVNAYYQPGEAAAGKTNSQWVGALEEYDLFDPLFFNISPTEAESMDPQQRLFLQECWHSIENAGYAAQSLSGSKCGVFVGCATNGDYHQLSREHQLSAQGFTGSAMSILAARISYLLNLQGPCISIDTACSSSLVAMAQACDSLVSGDSDLALVGGVYVMTGPEMHIKTSQAGMLSTEGKCFSFDQRADGFVPGEGVGVVMLKRLADAERDQDIIYGVVEGWGVNQDGKTNGITAPNPESQTRLEQEVYDKYQIDPAGIQLIEAHGTGTKLGDPIEVEGLKKAFKKYTQNKEYCALGAVKSNIGHSLTAAGTAGVIKLLLALKHRQLPPTINFEQLNEHIDLKDSAFYVNTALRPWELNGAPRRQAAISSFGFSGTNAHIVIAEYQPPVDVERPVTVVTQNGKTIIPLSAKTAAQLRQKASDLLAYLRNEGASADLFEVAYTLQTGRDAMDERLGILAGSIEQLTETLAAYASGETDIKDLHQGQVKRGRDSLSIISQDDDVKATIVDRWIAQKKLSKLLDLWVQGLELDWTKLYGEVKPRRISLPTYPFAKEHYWIEATAASLAAPGFTSSSTAVLHSLLHTNTSDFSQQSYSSTFSGEEFFLTDHQVRMQGNNVNRVLPAVAYLEMARAAIEQALRGRNESTVLELHNVVWVQPIVVDESTRVDIALSANERGEIDYEIYSQDDGDQEVVHGQGRAILSVQPAPPRLDLERLRSEMGQGEVGPDDVYASCARMGLIYGSSFQGITAIHRGSDQVLAELRLPKIVEGTAADFVLHPSVMDSALQSSIGLIDAGSARFNQPRLPFALDSLRIVSPCSAEMVVWVRYASGSKAADDVVKLDLDLCDDGGNVCVQMHGLSLRVLSAESSAAAARTQATGSLLAIPVWQAGGAEVSGRAATGYAEHHVLLCEPSTVDVALLESLLPGSQCQALQAEERKSIAQRYHDYALASFESIRSIFRRKPQGRVLFQLVVVDDQEQALLAGLSALLRTAALENPQFAGQLVLIPPGMRAEELSGQLQEEKGRAPEPAIRYAHGVRQVLRWQEVAADLKSDPVFRENGVYLITGGLGSLGLLFAREILDQTRSARVVLTGRSPLSAEKKAVLDALSAQAGRVSYRQLDLQDLQQVAGRIAAIEDEHGPLTGILHAAGMIADHYILQKPATEFSEVLAPKVTGAYHLDQATQDAQLDFFVLFSSIAGAIGNAGQADYAAANGFLDQFAEYRNRQVAAGLRHGRTRSINWPLWQAGGMSIDPASQELVQQTMGVRPMQTATGLSAFDRALALPHARLLVVEGHVATMRRALFSTPAAISEPQPKQTVAAVALDSGTLAERTQEYLRKQLAGVLKLPYQRIDPQAALETYGIDSILAMKLTNQLEKTFGSLSKTLFFEYQTIAELAGYFIAHHAEQLAALVTPAAAAQAETVASPAQTLPPVKPVASRRFNRFPSAVPKAAPASEPIAIIGLSGRYPEAVDLEAYWENLRQGKDCITEVPKERWDWREYFSEDRTASGHHYSKWGGFITGVDEFDPLFFNIAPKEARSIDPQERLFLQHAWMAIEDAGYTRASLQVPSADDLPGQVGVYAGVMYTEYQLFGADASARGKRMGVAGSAASISNRVSYALNLHGPSVTLDTMCSSSLTAIHFACQDLKLGRTALAIAGGVNVSIHPNKYLVLSEGQFISSDGHCQSFGEGGDGYIPGEGVGVVVLKRLSDAQRDGDHVYGIIRGSALNHGGKTNGYSVPNPQAQASAIGRALTESHTDARHISYIEAHGTGTKLGDPIEIAALNKAFHRDTASTGFCRLGSAKSNIGHCESAAGIAGLTKVLLQMQHRQIVPSLHSAQLNPHIDFAKSPFVVNQSLLPWEQPVVDGRTLPRIAGISSFGAGGSNAHLIVEEYQAPVRQPLAMVPLVILLSARTASQLQEKARDLAKFVRARMSTIDLPAVAWTLQAGREAMDERLGFIVSSVEQLAEKLDAFVAGEQGIEDAYQGQVKRNTEAMSVFSTDADLQQTIDKWIASRKLSKLVDLWVKGLEVDWSKLYGEAHPPRIALPTYPFAKERYWVDTTATAPVAARSAVTAVLHPLLHRNTSDLREQRYSSTFTGEEFFLTLQKALPAAAYLEMARAAIEHASPERPGSALLELRDAVWAEPFLADGNRQLNIALYAGDDEIDYEIYSKDAEREIVHCQGRALFSDDAAPARLDLATLERQMAQGTAGADRVYAKLAAMGLVYGPSLQAIESIRQGSNQLLAQLRLPIAIEGNARDYVLHPSLLDGALQAAAWLLGVPLPSALESLRIVSASSKTMRAWVRFSPGSELTGDAVQLDLDLCDEQGNVCVQMRGVRWQQASLVRDEQQVLPAARVKLPIAARTPKEIDLGVDPVTPLPSMERRKPTGISLAAPGAPADERVRPFSAARPSVTLNAKPGSLAAPAVRLYDRGEGVFAIEIAASANSHAAKAIDDLRQALDRVGKEMSVKVLTIGGAERVFARGGREDSNEAVSQRLYQTVAAFPYPVIAVLHGNAIGAGFLFAALCDFMVCSEDASYGYTGAGGDLDPTPAEAVLFSERFGDVAAQDLLYRSTVATGRQLRAKGWTCPIVPAAQAGSYAEELAWTLATKSRDALRLLKQHLTRDLLPLAEALTRVEVAADRDSQEPAAKPIAAPMKYLRLDTPSKNVLVVTLRAIEPVELHNAVTELGQLVAAIHQNASAKAVVLASESPDFLPGAAAGLGEQLVLDLQRTIVESRVPVVAALDGDAKGDAWLTALFCDASVYSRTGVYSSARAGASTGLAQTLTVTFADRFGNEAAREILLTAADYSGVDLQRRTGIAVAVEQNRVLPAAVKLAESWAGLPHTALAAWKERSATTIREKIRRLPAAAAWVQDDTSAPLAAAPTTIALRSEVVTATAYPDGVVLVKMQDRQAKNMFSEAFMEGVAEVFAHIAQTPSYKVVVLTGYDSYFASGGTKESLLAIQAGKAKFTDSRVFQSALDCKLPVIAAMQGHGIGAGWSLGMFADLVLLSDESRYVSPYMDYGFTPGAGATWSLADKIGQDLARESLLTAQPVTGSALKARGVLLPVLPRAEVLPAAMVLARQIARVSRDRLIGLKRQLTAYVREPLEETYRRELAMHEQTFVGQSETLAQIHHNFHQESETSPAAPPPPQAEPVQRAVHGDVLPAIAATLRTLLASELQMSESDIDDHTQFVDLGLDSISGVSWIRKVNEKYQTSIEATKIYSHPTLTQLARFVKAEAEANGTLSAPAATPAPEIPVPVLKSPAMPHRIAAERTVTSRRSRTAPRVVVSAPAAQEAEPIAIIGMAGQFPQARNVDEFWQNIAQGRNCISRIPAGRWDVDAYYQPGDAAPGKTNSQWVGALEEYDLFDPLFFNISPTEAESMDPQQRLFLQTAWHSIEDAGYDPRSLSGSKCGVFVGCATGDYHQLSRRHQLSAQGFTGNAMSILAARISYFLNLQGACVAIDTACSSSLVAMAQACDSLISGTSDLALAGGVYVMAGPEMHIRTSQAAMLSAEGKCFTFDQRADGFVPGEGVGVVVLKRLADAQRDGDIIYGLVEGWGVNQDGKSNGITAPNPESQTRLEQDVYDKYRIDPSNIQLIEAHGTGTKLGDPIEVEGLKASFQKYTQNEDYCALGSVKSNIGHTLTAAGVAGVIKLLLALKHRQLPPTINFERLNEHIDLEGSPFYVNTRLQPWETRGAPRRQAAISSFGFSGTNAHLVIGEYLPPVRVERPVAVVSPNAKTIIPLSARTPEQLRERASDLLLFLRKHGLSVDLDALAYTLQVGRAAMDERLGFVVSSAGQLAEKLQAYVDGRQGIEDTYQGQVRRNKEALSVFHSDADLQQTIDKWLADRKLPKLLDLWVKGLDLDWNKLHGEVKPQRISVPVYPFAKERYWIDTAASTPAAAAATAVLHPLLHRNTSDLSEQRYSSTFTGQEFFLAGQPEPGQSLLPAAVYLEMARAAIEHASPARTEPATLELRDTVWPQPVVITAETPILIALRPGANGEIDYEIYSENAEQEIVHCQGRAVLSQEPAPASLDLEQLRRSGQTLARLHVPADLAESSADYVLHPSLMDGAIRAAIGSTEGLVPFALETLRIVSPCTAEMVAWVRHDGGAQGEAAKLDIDLCDESGNVCVQMRGLSSRVPAMTIGAAAPRAAESLLATPVWRAGDVVTAGVQPAYAEHHVLLCELPSIDASKLEALVARSRCRSLEASQGNIAQRYGEHALACFETIQAILRGKPQGKVLVQLAVAGQQEQALLAGLSGLLKTAALENPQFTGQVLLTSPQTTPEELARHLLEEKTGALESLVRYERGVRQVLRWEEVAGDASTPPVAFKDHGVYLITGGMGGLGLLFAQEILGRTSQSTVVLTGRSPFHAEIQSRIDLLSTEPGRVSYRQVELGDLDQVRRSIAGIRDEYGRLDGILHCAGMMIVKHSIVDKPAAELREVLAPKVTGTFHLDQASRDTELDFFVLFSSIASAVGNPRTSDYAAANGFLDQFAAYRNRQVAAGQRHGRTRSINWPLWEAGGMVINHAWEEVLRDTVGMQPMRSATGIDAFHRSLALACDQLLVVEGDRPKIAAYLERARILEPVSRTETASQAVDSPRTQVRAAASASASTYSIEQVQQRLKELLGALLRIKTSIIDVDQAFAELGLDSILGTELMTAINNEYGTKVPGSRLFDYPTVRELALYLQQEIRTLPRASEPAPAAPFVQRPLPMAAAPVAVNRKIRSSRAAGNTQTRSSGRIAIIGMSGRYPEAENLQQYWENLAQGRNSIAEVPASRWDVHRYYDPDPTKKDKTNSRWLGAVDGIDCFDPLFFRISPQEADYIDPHHRLFLQESYRAFEDAGYSSSTLANKKCGVYLGISANEYALLLAKSRVLGDAPVTSNHTAIAAARIAYYLNLKGPAISVDTACSSSLVAIHLACQALLGGETDMALAGGVALWLTPESYLSMTQAGMLSAVGQCQAFDDKADGIVVGDGVGALVLKRLEDAEADRDFIYGVILGSGINQDGRTNGITAPSVNSQIELERGLYARHQIDPETISYVEAHGTGTVLGDPIELEALATVFKEKTSRKNFCAVGSVKTNIGHTTSAAGVAGVQKVLLSLQHRTLVPSLNVTTENTRFDFADSPFYISRETQAWETAPGTLRRAAVSSFGFSGTNAHLVIEEYPSAERPAPSADEPAYIVPLSARTAEQLRQRARDLLEFIRTAQQPLALANIAYTLQTGREPMEERAGFVVSSVEALAEKLAAFGSGAKHIEDAQQGRVEPGNDGMSLLGGDDDMQEAIEKWIARKKLPKLLDLWIRGMQLDWQRLYGDVTPRRIPLPAYPFARDRYWVDSPLFDEGADTQAAFDENMRSIEDIINDIGDDVVDTAQAVKALKMLV